LRKNLSNVHKQYPESWWENIPDHWLTTADYDESINKYKVECGTPLEYWESKNWKRILRKLDCEIRKHSHRGFQSGKI